MLSKISIKFRVALLTAILLSVVCLILTFISINSADAIFNKDSNNYIGEDTIIVGQSQTENYRNFTRIKNDQDKFANKQFLYMAMVICIGTAISYLLASKAIEPITNFSKEVEKIDEYNLKSRVDVPKSNDEVSILANSFNQLLSKIDKAFENQRLFTQNVAHELKTPLTSIMANIDVLELDENPTNEELMEVVGIAKKNIERLSAIVNDITSMNTCIDNQQFEAIDFLSMVNEIEDELYDFISEKNITIIKNGNKIIYGNKALLYRAFYNLILNAIRYNKNNGNIEIICEYKKIIIADTGIGIPETSLDKIFEPFYCVDNSRSKLLGGSGLGLSLVKSILDKHNLKINIESQLNVGTKIIITF